MAITLKSYRYNNLLPEAGFNKNAKENFHKEMKELITISNVEKGSGTRNTDYLYGVRLHLMSYMRTATEGSHSFWLLGTPDKTVRQQTYDFIGESLCPCLEKEEIYIVGEYPEFTFLLANSSGEITGVMSFESSVSEKYVRFFGEDIAFKILQKALDDYFPADLPDTACRLVISDNSPNRVLGKRKRLQNRKPCDDWRAFWPYLEQSPADLAKAFDESDANVLILYGAPGLGKSQYIREMVNWKNNQRFQRCFIADTDNVLKSQGMIPFLHELDDESWLITEDMMVMLEKRESGNSFMTGLLNAVEGITSGNVKFIISTNLLSLKGVDDAIIRPGRLFKAMPFKPLTPAEANAARNGINLPPVEFDSSVKDVTLAQALNWETYLETKTLTQTSFL